jgi:hypothetical protein
LTEEILARFMPTSMLTIKALHFVEIGNRPNTTFETFNSGDVNDQWFYEEIEGLEKLA